MDSKERQTLSKAMSYKNYSTPTKKHPAAEKLELKTTDIKTTDKVIPIRKDIPPRASDSFITSERLQEAIIWSEIIGKPVSKRGKRR